MATGGVSIPLGRISMVGTEYCILLYGVTSQVRRGERIVKSENEGKAVQFSSLIIALSFANESRSGPRV